MSDLPPRRAETEAGARPARLSEEDCARLRVQLARAVARVCPSWLSAQSDDIVQAALMRVVEILGAREGDEGLNSSYLWKVAYTATVDEIRRLRRRREVTLEEGSVESTMASPQPGPEQARAGQEIGREVQDCLRRLVEPRRLAVVLHLQGHTGPEAARLLGWSEKRVENLIYRGLADLRRCLSAKGLQP
jgi:RNA polymerase sigma-70 factor (ECF subfamily)